MLLAALVDASNHAGQTLGFLLGSNPRPGVADIQRAVAKHYKIAPIDMVSSRRSREVAWPRQTAMYLAAKLTPQSLPAIGRRFGNRDHTTVIHAIKAVEHRIATDPETARAVRHLTAVLEMGE